jgi:glycosyltransferase involved in cell wall biosynthesis
MESAEAGLSPTHWQAGSFPQPFRSRITVAHDGIDTELVAPRDDVVLTLNDANGTLRLTRQDEVITFVNRNLEPYRGYHVFMRALPEIQRRLPDARVLLVGGDGVSYGASPPAGTSWKQHFLDEVAPDLYLKLLQVSAAHVYLTYPFVLSWSCLEAMSACCHVIGSRTEPVQEFIEDGVNGTLVDFFDRHGLAMAVEDAVRNRPVHAALRAAARRTVVERCDLHDVCLPQWRALLSRLMEQPV